MDLNRLRTGEQIAVVAAIVLILDMFIFKWFGLEATAETPLGTFGAEGSDNAWGSFDVIDIILLITVVAALAMGYLRATATEVNLPVSVAVTVLGAVSTILILYRLINPPDFGIDAPGVDETRKIGAWIGLVTAAVLTYGGWRAMQEEGTSFQETADRFGGPGPEGPGPGAGGEPPSAPPPPPGAPPSA